MKNPYQQDGSHNSTGRDAWLALQDQMPVRQKWAYFDNAAVAPLPQTTADEVRRWLEQASTEGDAVWLDWAAKVNQARKVAARLIGAESSETAFVANTTTGIGLVAEGLAWKPGDNVVTLTNEFPSNLFPWMNLADRGVETRLVPVENGIPDLDRLSDACDERTRIITVSWVGYASGYRLNVADVAQIAKSKDCLFFLDAIQGIGAFALDVHKLGVDFLAADGHKWMLGPEGAGILFVANHALEQLRATGVGWNSVKQRGNYQVHDLTLRPEASRFEGGSYNMMGLHALGTSLELLESCGLSSEDSALGHRIVHLTDTACDLLTSAGASIVSPRIDGHKSGIVVFEVPGVEPTEIRTACLANKIVVSCRGGGVRISPHAYNDEDELQRLCEVVGTFSAS